MSRVGSRGRHSKCRPKTLAKFSYELPTTCSVMSAFYAQCQYLSTYVKKLLGTQYFQFVDYFFYFSKSFFYIFKGITHAAVWAACCSFIAHNTDAELRPSAQSFIQGLHHGFGKFCGAVFGGMLVQKLGTIMVFRIYGGC